MKLICKCYGGSIMYGLETPTSDVDYRGIYCNNNISTLIGLSKHEHQVSQNKDEDSQYFEFRNALNLLRRGNSQLLELIYNTNWIEISYEWQLVQRNKIALLDSEIIYKCLKGYSQGELRLANGLRTGALGSKRKESITKYGFSPKNFVNLYRLLLTGEEFFLNDKYIVNFKEYPKIHKVLLDLKINPQNYKVEDLNSKAAHLEAQLDFAFKNRKMTYKFNQEVADQLCLAVYAPLVKRWDDWLIGSNIKYNK